MGDFADDALNLGVDSPLWFTKEKIWPDGPGKCPLCKSETIIKKGPYGKFYGCVNFPHCKGKRIYSKTIHEQLVETDYLYNKDWNKWLHYSKTYNFIPVSQLTDNELYEFIELRKKFKDIE